MPIGKTAVPQQLGEKSLRKLGIFPAAILQKFQTVFTDVSIFDKFLDVTEKGDNCCLHYLIFKVQLESYLVLLNKSSSASCDSGSS
jgi:hypothetical protein